MGARFIFISIKPKHLTKIVNCEKTVEFRKWEPQELNAGDYVVVYCSKSVKSIVGVFSIKEIIIKDTLRKLLNEIRRKGEKPGASYKELKDNYFKDANIFVGFVIDEYWQVSEPITYKQLKRKGFSPPQYFQKLKKGKGSSALKLKLVGRRSFSLVKDE